MCEWRTVCGSTPFVASIRMTARSAVEARGRHVAGILLVPRRVGDDELAAVAGEEAVGDVDRDALLALGGEAIDQQCEVELAAARAEALAVAFERAELVREQAFGIVQQATNQRGFAVIHRAASDEAQQRLRAVGGEIGVEIAFGDGAGRSAARPSNPVIPAEAGIAVCGIA